MKIQGNNPVESQGQPTRTEAIDKYHENQKNDISNKTADGKDRVTISEEAKEIQRSTERSSVERVEEKNRTADTDKNNHDSTTGAKDILDKV